MVSWGNLLVRLQKIIEELAKLMHERGTTPILVRMNEQTIKELSTEFFEWAKHTMNPVPTEVPIIAKLNLGFCELVVIEDYFAPQGAIRVE